MRVPRLQAIEHGPFASRTYRNLFTAQVISLIGTGVTSVALSLLAYEIADSNAGAVLGVALALKMVAYVGFAPVIAAYASRFDRRRLLITLDLIRVVIISAMPFVTEVWEVFVLVFVLNACAAGFTPAFQATLPVVLPDQDDYTRALSLSRLAYDLQELLSPALAAALLLLMDFSTLFVIDAATFVLSAALIARIRLDIPHGAPVSDRTLKRITAGIRQYLATTRLRGLLALNLAVASASAMTVVNSVIIVRDEFGKGQAAVAVALGAAGAGSMIAALLVPSLLKRVRDRTAMLVGGALITPALLLIPALPAYWTLLPTWMLLGVALSLIQTPAGRLIQRSGTTEELPALFAAQFSLSHACWLLTYPIAGVVGVAIGINNTALILAAIAAAAVATAVKLWPPEPQAAAA